jgi:hypothetical protein
MINKTFLIAVIFIGLVLNIYPQQTFRRAIWLHGSVGNHIYNHANVGEAGTTNVPAEIDLYNTANNYVGDEAVTMDEVEYPELDGNTLWSWSDIFDSTNVNYDIYSEYVNDTTYNIIIIKECFTTSDIWFYWYDGPQDTANYPVTHSIYNYQRYVRKIIKKMELHPDKFFVFWNLPCTVTTYSTEADAARLYWFNHWMTDTLATGTDTLYGDFPNNVYIYDYFTVVDSSNFMPFSLADDPYDSHPNAAGADLVAPDFVEKAFDAAIYYEEHYPLPVELSSFTAQTIESFIYLTWRTETEVNNYGFEILRQTKGDKEWVEIGFVNGNGNSNSPKEYTYTDKNLIGGSNFLYRLKQVDNDGQFAYSDAVEVEVVPNQYELSQNFSNPFNPSTKIRYQLPKESKVVLRIYNILGSEVMELVNDKKEAGVYEVEFNANNLSSGTYIYKITADNFVQTKKMILLK